MTLHINLYLLFVCFDLQRAMLGEFLVPSWWSHYMIIRFVSREQEIHIAHTTMIIIAHTTCTEQIASWCFVGVCLVVMQPGDNGHLHIITAVITIIITVARYSAVFHIKNISQDWSLTNICSATSNTNIFLITNIFFPFPLQSCAQTSHLDGWRFYHFHVINCLKMSLSSTRTFDLVQSGSTFQC